MFITTRKPLDWSSFLPFWLNYQQMENIMEFANKYWYWCLDSPVLFTYFYLIFFTPSFLFLHQFLVIFFLLLFLLWSIQKLLVDHYRKLRGILIVVKFEHFIYFFLYSFIWIEETLMSFCLFSFFLHFQWYFFCMGLFFQPLVDDGSD